MRLVYLGYYIKKTDWNRIGKYTRFVKKETGKSILMQYIEMVFDSLRYNISFTEYFLFSFYHTSKKEKVRWAGTGFMYEYQLLMNPKVYRTVLENKSLFLDTYGEWIHHIHVNLEDAIAHPEKLDPVINNRSGKMVLKSKNGQCGEGIEIFETKGMTSEGVIQRMKETGNDLAETFVQQHHELDRLSSSGLNTLRIITQLDQQGKVELLGARLRITVNSSVDNLAAGNIAAPVDLKTGVVSGKAIYSDITKEPVEHHPVTGTRIVGFKVPYFDDSLKMVSEAASAFPNNRSIGWDVAITEQGPGLIEGNHDWCKLLWQLPMQEGLKDRLTIYL